MNKLYKILMLVENLSVPADPRVWREACALRDYGLQVSIICPKGSTRDCTAYAYIDGIHIYRYSLPANTGSTGGYLKEYSAAMFKSFWLSLKVWKRHGFDAIHAANPPDTFFVLGLFYRLFGKKYIFDQHDLAPEAFRVRFQKRMQPLYRLHLLLERCSYRSAHVVITTNESQRICALQRGGCPPERVFVVRNGPDLQRFQQFSVEPDLKRGKRYLLAYVGVMGMQDGVENALYALNELIHRRGRHDVGLVLIGDGEQLPKLKALTHQLQLEEYVHFTGWVSVPEMLRYLSAADIGLSPDPSNELNDHSTMLKTMEYMAMGIPVVAFDLPETHYSAQDSALYAPPNRVDQFATCIETLLDNADLRNSLGQRGRQRIKDALCWEHTKKHLWQAYNYLFTLPRSSAQQTNQESEAILSAEEV
jgi:glycosyltransferase involved in cell wall biosynthesis